MAYSTSIAQGNFGKVYKQKYNDTWAAIKKVPQHLINRKALERECDVYKKSEHPNIVKLLGNITLMDEKWVIPLEFIFGEDLETTIFKATKSKLQLTPANKGTIIVGMCEGLLHLHSKDIVHQDLKPDNIMVEHKTNRAVIIDLGLAKFFRHGLNSATDMGNDAYAAPELMRRGIQRGIQRDHRSDVWAMGKIIAELCARIRLHPPSVCPTKIKETLKDQPYCQAVCRMVDPDPSLRASMGGIINDIRVAGGKRTAAQKDFPKLPSPNIDVGNRSPSPINGGAPPTRRDPSPIRRDPARIRRDPACIRRDPSPFRRDPSPFRRDHSPLNRPLPPINRPPSPVNWKREPRPELKLRPETGLCPPPAPNWAQDTLNWQRLAPKGWSDLTQDFTKMQLHQEVAKDLLCNLPATGRVMVRHFEQKIVAVEKWEQKEVVTRNGQIVKFDDIKFNNK